MVQRKHHNNSRTTEARSNPTLFSISGQIPQDRITWPKECLPKQRYMRIASRRKLIQIRDTIYDDPGNPFADEEKRHTRARALSCDKPLPLPPQMCGPEWEVLEKTDSRVSSGTRSGSPDTSLEVICECEEGDACQAHPPAKSEGHHGRQGSPVEALVSPLEASPNDAPPARFWQQKGCVVSPVESRDDGPPQGFWEGGSELRGPALKAPDDAKEEDVRNTKFYGFYDDLMRTYDRQER